MLTADLVQVRLARGEVKPRYLRVEDPEHQSLAGRLIAIFEAHVGQPRHALDGELRDLLGTGTAFQLHRALAKLLRDRCTFGIEAAVEPEALRETVFAAAAEVYRADPAERDGESVPLAAGDDDRDDRDDDDGSARDDDSEGGGDRGGDDERRAFGFDRDAVLRAAAEVHQLAPDALESGLYGDLKDQQVLQAFKACTPSWLLQRYNVALAQGVLYRATGLTVKLAAGDPRTHRTLFRKIKFFQLMHRIERDGEGWTIHLDGPLSVLRASGRYGLQMALFLPTLLHFDGWTLEAALRWTKARHRRTFTLGAGQGLVSHTRLTGQWQPEEVAALPAAFAALETGWTVSTDAELIDLGGEGVLVPDFVFEHAASGTRVVMEVFGFWNRGAVKARLRQLRRHGPGNVVIALSKRLATAQDDLDDLGAEVYVYRSSPLPRRVLKVLEGMRPKTKRRRKRRSSR